MDTSAPASIKVSCVDSAIGMRTAPVTSTQARCSVCSLRNLCLPCGLPSDDIENLDDLVYTRKRVKAGEALYQVGAPFKSLYAVRSGFFKSYIVMEDGREQVTGFQMGGEVIGLDGVDADHHAVNVVALEDSEVCVIPYTRLEEVSTRVPALRRQLHRTMSREIVRDHGVMMLLGSMSADERVAAFLLNLSQRFAARGYAASQFSLRMSREEIGSYLGLKLETVSRVLSKFDADGLLSVHKRQITIRNIEGLRKVLVRTEA